MMCCKFIKIPNDADYADFKARYLELTNMAIQNTPLENVEETHYLVGTHKLSDATQAMLEAEFPNISITNDTIPAGWTSKEMS